MDGLRGPAASGEALGVQRREPGEHGEHHAQPRVPRPAEGGPRVPGRAHLRHVVGHRRPPARRGGAARRRAGMDEERRVARLEAVEQGLRPPVHERRAGSVIPRAPASSSASTASAVSAAPHSSNGSPSSRMPWLNASTSGSRLVGRQRLDPERGGERDDDAVDALALGLGGARDGIVVAFLQRAGRLAGQLEAQRGTGAHHPRSRRTPRQRADQRLGEEVLVEVGPHRRGHIRTKSTDLVGKATTGASPGTALEASASKQATSWARPGRWPRSAGQRPGRSSANFLRGAAGLRDAAWPRRRSPRRRSPRRAAAPRACRSRASRARRA